MSASRRVLRIAARGAVVTSMVAAVAVIAPAITPGAGRVIQAAGPAFGAGGEYHALTPVRVLDTRVAALDAEPLGPKRFATTASDSTFDVQIVGRDGLPAAADANSDCSDDNVLAVAVNITVVNPSSLGYLQAFGKGATSGSGQADSSIVNFKAGEYVANTAVLRPGCDGKLTIRLFHPTNIASSDVLIDIFGWFSSSSYTGGADAGRGARLEPAGPGRILDTREAAYGAQPLAAGGIRNVAIRGVDSYDPVINDIVPAGSDVVGVLVNLTAVNNIPGSSGTYVSLLPDAPAPGTEPKTSNVNLRPGQVRSNLAIVPLAADGSIQVYNRAGNTHVILDVMGYFVKKHDDTRRGRVLPLVAPFRAFDTRKAEFEGTPLPPATKEDWSFDDFVNDVKIGAESVDAQLGLLGNLTATDLGRQYSWAPVASYMTAYPSPLASAPQTPPLISNLGISEGETVPNLVMLTYGTTGEAGADAHMVRFYNRAGYVDYILDASAVILDD